ncbi:hypothetical protein A21D_03526 [Virgibacillus dokdonensis]|uniref:Uncharacterized protein n=1 Tax=Virgibacillus dokdonensis TaxID=302167 RepID=A0A2K9J969_9BACI|nr:hypothetical protein A21D_03526 [Virgibacillus dokdonensis]
MFKSNYYVYGVWRDSFFRHHVEVINCRNTTKSKAIERMYDYLCYDPSFKRVSFRSVVKVFTVKVKGHAYD